MFKSSSLLSRQTKTILSNNHLMKSKHSNEALSFHYLKSRSSKNEFHQSQIQEYPATKPLPLPPNIQELASVEKLKFSPLRTRDISGFFISSSHTTSNLEDCKFHMDERMECYDCSGSINLSSTMQSNVPYPFASKGKPTHLNMPGAHWRQKEKYISEELNNVHYTNGKALDMNNGGVNIFSVKLGSKDLSRNLWTRDLSFQSLYLWSKFNANQFRSFCSVKEEVKKTNGIPGELEIKTQGPQLTLKQKLKQAVKDYGSVVIVFHVGISLVSLGCCYLAVASGIDMSSIFKYWGVDEGAATAGTAAHFVVAYAIHKTMAPVRIAITLTAVPFVVKKLRKIGFLKPPK